MSDSTRSSSFSNLSADLPAGLVVFLVAVPLCLGIAQASGAPLLSGMIAGITGGLVVAGISRSNLSVSGPAAGLVTIVAAGILEVGLGAFFLAVMIAGAIQIALGLARLGSIAHFFPTSVIKGMLAAIGVLIVLKQLPHAVGYDRDFEGDNAFVESDGSNTFTALLDAASAFDGAAILVTLIGVAATLLWPKVQRTKLLRLIPTPLIVVVGGALTAWVLPMLWTGGVLSSEHMVALPVAQGAADLLASIHLPDVAAISDARVWEVGLTLAIVASIETLLSLEAVDRIDPDRRVSPPNRELVAQGFGNLVSGLLGGLPVTSVIVRSSANVVAGAKTRASAMTHGLLLLAGVLFLAPVLNHIPLAALAVVLIAVGLKLTPPSLWVGMWRAGWSQFVPFAVTVLAVVFTDLLKGTMIGLVVGLILTLRAQQKRSVVVIRDDDRYLIRATKDLTFLQKGVLKEVFLSIPDKASVLFDRSRANFVDADVEALFDDFAKDCLERGIHLEWRRARNEPPPSVIGIEKVSA